VALVISDSNGVFVLDFGRFFLCRWCFRIQMGFFVMLLTSGGIRFGIFVISDSCGVFF